MILKASNISYNRILKNISLSLEKGELLGIIGPNGAGKSTLVKILTGIITPNSGNIIIYNKNLSSMKAFEIARNISYIPQELTVLHDIIVKDFLYLYRYSFFENMNKSESIIEEAAKLCGISCLLSRNLRTLSGGEKQKVQIAGAVVQRAGIWICDEPTSSLDPGAKSDFYSMIDNIRSKKEISILITSHDLTELVSRADNILAIKDGKIFFDGICAQLDKDILSSLYDSDFNMMKYNGKRIFTIS